MADDVWECIKQSNPIYANLCAQAPNQIACHGTNLSKRLLICTASTSGPFSLIGKGKTLEEADSLGNFSEYWKIKPMAGSTTNHSKKSIFRKKNWWILHFTVGCPKKTLLLSIILAVESLVRMGVLSHQKKIQNYRPINDP